MAIENFEKHIILALLFFKTAFWPAKNPKPYSQQKERKKGWWLYTLLESVLEIIALNHKLASYIYGFRVVLCPFFV
jgi:hypothetical protein